MKEIGSEVSGVLRSREVRKSMFLVFVLLFTALVASGMDDVRYRSEKGCAVCGKAWQKGRRFSATERFGSEELREAFGREVVTGNDLCSACERAISTWRRTGKRSKVNNFTKLTAVSSVSKLFLLQTTYSIL